MAEILFHLQDGCEDLIGTHSSRVGALTQIGADPNAKAFFWYGETKYTNPTTLTSDQISHIQPITEKRAWEIAPKIGV